MKMKICILLCLESGKREREREIERERERDREREISNDGILWHQQTNWHFYNSIWIVGNSLFQVEQEKLVT